MTAAEPLFELDPPPTAEPPVADGWAMEVFVAGRPAAQGSKRHVGGGRLIEQSKAVGPWRTVVAWSVAQAWTVGPLDGPVVIALDFVMPRPTSTPKRSTPPAIRRPDVDKCTRAVFDAVTGVAWRDDSQVVHVAASKRIAEIGETPGAWIAIREATTADTRPRTALRASCGSRDTVAYPELPEAAARPSSRHGGSSTAHHGEV